MLEAKVVLHIFVLANAQDFFCDEIIILQQLDNMQLQKSDFNPVSYAIIILAPLWRSASFYQLFHCCCFGYNRNKMKTQPCLKMVLCQLSSTVMAGDFCTKRKQTSGNPRISDLAHSRTETINSL